MKGDEALTILGMPETIFWLVLVVIFGIAEAVTLGLVSIWFAFGALVAMLASLTNMPFLWQVIIFVVASGAVLIFVRPLSKKYLKVGKAKTNADRVVSMTGIVTETIDNEKAQGLMRVNGQIWTARSQTGEVIEKGRHVKVMEIQGVKLIVNVIEEKQEVEQ